MAYKQMPTDPMLRLQVGLSWIKKEWKLSAGLLLAALLSLLVVGWGATPGSSPWGPRELQTMSGLPLAPAGSGLPDDSGIGVSRQDVEEFAKLQRELSKMPRPDLVDRQRP